MAEGSPNGATIANGTMRNGAGDVPHGAARDVWNPSVLDVGVGNARAEDEFVASTLDVLELGKARNVDDQVWLYQP